MEKSFDPQKVEAIFTLVASVKNNILNGALNAAMANLVKAVQFYLSTPMLKKEREILEDDFYDLLLKISGHPTFAQTYGPVSFRKGEHGENIQFLQQLITFGAEDIQEKIAQGLELLEAERLDEAWALFMDVMNNPDAEISHFITIGDTYLKKKKWLEAQEVFAKALARDPESIHIMNRVAIAFRKGGEFEKALAIYREAIMLSPKDEGLYYNVARLFLDMGKTESAGQALRKALFINPRFAPAAKLLTGVQEMLAGVKRKSPEDD